jgi:hypothetical protein
MRDKFPITNFVYNPIASLLIPKAWAEMILDFLHAGHDIDVTPLRPYLVLTEDIPNDTGSSRDW